MLTTVAPFATIVILLVWMGFFMLGSLPLMILKHDTPDRLRMTMTATDTAGIRQFRKLHVLGMPLNMVQLLTICFGLPSVL